MDAFADDVPLGKMALTKAQELFKSCDKEDKGFIIKRDMQRLAMELPGLTPDQLEEVFDSLDQDKNGYLTMDEFVRGFGAFLGLQIDEEEPASSLADEISSTQFDNQNDQHAVDEEQFKILMEQIGATEVLPDQDVTKKLWLKLRNDEPELLSNFEDFLHSVSSQIKQSQEEFNSLENVLQTRTSTHDDEIKKLYDEMETQIRYEKERQSAEEESKLQKIKEEMMKELNEKDYQLKDFITKHQEMEKRLEELSSVRNLTEVEKIKLAKEREEYEIAKDRMQSELETTRKLLDEHRQQLELVKKQTRDERRERAKAAFRVTEGIATEREDLVKQLDFLRQVNKKLQDERDEMKSLQEPAFPPPIQQMKRDSIIGNYLMGENNNDERFPKPPTSCSMPPLAHQSLQVSHPLQQVSHPQQMSHPLQHMPHPLQSSYHPSLSMTHQLQTISDQYEVDDCEVDEDLLQYSTTDHRLTQPFQINNSLMSELGQAMAGEKHDDRERVEPLGGNEKIEQMNKQHRKESSYTPERIFKVVFVGDSGVGKTCFLHRFCHNRFRSTFSATIGVDFQVKSLKVEDRIVALQLWDTAGQERFRSITKQYFRKADGVLLMYDVSSELSFLNLRNWMQSVKEGVEQDCVLCLVGNKLDLCDNNEDFRVVKHKDGLKLADEFNALFFETSASTGDGIHECMQAMSILLRDREDQHLEKALQLQMEVTQKKRKCCGRR